MGTHLRCHPSGEGLAILSRPEAFESTENLRSSPLVTQNRRRSSPPSMVDQPRVQGPKEDRRQQPRAAEAQRAAHRAKLQVGLFPTNPFLRGEKEEVSHLPPINHILEFPEEKNASPLRSSNLAETKKRVTRFLERSGPSLPSRGFPFLRVSINPAR